MSIVRPPARLRRLRAQPSAARHLPRLGAQQLQKAQVNLRRVPVDPARDAVGAAQVRRAERQHSERRALARLGGALRHQGEPVGRRLMSAPPLEAAEERTPSDVRDVPIAVIA